jgi:hypothetical protein
VSLPSYCYQDFVEVVELQVINLASALAASVPALPPSVLQRIRRGSSFVRSAASGAQVGAQGSASSESPSISPFQLAHEARGGARGGASDSGGCGGGGGTASIPVRPVGRTKELDEMTLRQLCLRLNNCEWAAEQLLALASRLRAGVPALGRLPGRAVEQCEQSCRDLLYYIAAKVVYYELEPALVTALYLPRPEEARLSGLLGLLTPRLAEMCKLAAPRWTQGLLEGVLSTLAIAIAAVIELPDRHFAPHHKALLEEDVNLLGAAFLKATGGALEEPIVRAALSVIRATGDEATG